MISMVPMYKSHLDILFISKQQIQFSVYSSCLKSVEIDKTSQKYHKIKITVNINLCFKYI